MRLHYAHHGRKFFFLTICVRGRKAVLSRLVAKDGGSGAPAPLPPLPREMRRFYEPRLEGGAGAVPPSVAVSLTRKKTLAEHEPEITALAEKARQGWILVCGFLSPGEKELGRRLRAEPNTRWIKTMAQGLPPRFDPPLEDSRFLAAHRQLLLSALPIGAPFDWNTCHTMNAHAAAMCRRARGEE